MDYEVFSQASIDINGEQPPIVGQLCQKLIAVELSHAGVVAEPANVVYLQFNGRWYRLYFDFGAIFWRVAKAPPADFTASEIDCTFRLVDVGSQRGLEQRRLRGISYSTISGGSEVRFDFDADVALSVRCVNDHTTYA